MLQFDSKGNLKPYQPIRCTLNEFKKHFVAGIDSDTRKVNFEKYILYSDDLKALLGGVEMRQWVNGSFVTKKKNPGDIDLITFLDSAGIKKLGNKLVDFRASGSWTAYGVDAYLLENHPEGSKNFRFTEADMAYWQNLFSKTRTNRRGNKYPKGFLEIMY